MTENQIKAERDEALRLKGSYEEGLRQNAKVIAEFEELYSAFTPKIITTLTEAGIDMTFLSTVDKGRLQYDKDYLDQFKSDLYNAATVVKGLSSKN